MKGFFQNPVTRFRYTAYAEGISFLLLLGVAMPLKYLADMPEAVKYTGWAHGLLFVAYIFFLIEVKQLLNWSFGKFALGFIASLLPFGPFIADKKLLPDNKG